MNFLILRNYNLLLVTVRILRLVIYLKFINIETESASSFSSDIPCTPLRIPPRIQMADSDAKIPSSEARLVFHRMPFTVHLYCCT